MEEADLLISPRWVIPVEPHGAVLEDHAVAVADGRITAVLPAAEAARRFPSAERVDRPAHVLLPGLVNAHTHAAMTLFRGLADDLPLQQWLGEHIWPAEQRWASSEFVRDGAELACVEMLRGGTTCLNDMYFFPDQTAQVAADTGIRAVVGMIVIEQPTPWAATVDEYFDKGLAVHDQFRGHPRIQTAFAPHAPYTVGDDSLRRLRKLADELDVQVHMHVHETANEISTAVAAHGRRPLARLAELGLLSPALAAVHMTQLTPDEITTLADTGASVVHCPESNLKLASGLCPVADLQAAGVNVALGTDGAASNNDLDMFGEMRTAALLAKSVAGDPAAVSAADALAMATINGARALGVAADTGSLVPGKSADMICLDLAHPATQPVYHPVSQVVYAATRDQVTDVWVGGQALIMQGELQLAHAADLEARAEGWRERVARTDV
ncbi:MAG: TRZ/ATZ family hydrolase [Chromatiales bacterium]|nr:MAG: TRZ/ATZ family hydrolase [Chromatiales bacterium]